jgi:uncharacterized protein
VASEREAFEAVSGGEAARLRALLEDDPGLAAARDPDGVSLLLRAQYAMSDELVAAVLTAAPALDVHEAAAVGDADRVGALLDGRPELVGAAAADGFAPLHLAAFFRRPAVVRVLLSRGADPNARAANDTRVAPLHSAAAAGDRESVEVLLAAGAEPGARQQGGFAPLHAAAAAGDRELVELLLESGADPAPEADDGRTPAALARERGHPELERVLVVDD